MAFLYEKDLKEKFWESYNRKGRAIKYEFESPIRDGNADLITIEKEKIINDRYMCYLREKRYIGVIGVESGGRYCIIYQPNFQQEIKVNQTLINMMMRKY